jgi:DNA-binding Xre family transcriptional regulator
MAFKVKVKDSKLFLETMIKKGYSVRKLAVEADLSDTTIQLLMTGDRTGCSPSTASKILKVLGNDFDDLFFIEDADKSYHEQAASQVI